MQMPGRKYIQSNSNYRYGFNGKEKANEITTDDYDFGARILDGRIGRWLSVDPLEKKYVSFTPYCFVGNSPIMAMDPDGQKIIYAGLSKEEKKQIKAAIKLLKKSDIFKQMYKELEKSKTEISFSIFVAQEGKAAGRVDHDIEGNEKVNWGNKDIAVLGQELFHSYQGIKENKEIYKGATDTDKEAEGEVATHFIMNEVGGDKYFPIGGTSPPETKNSPIVFSPVFNYNPSPTAEEVSSDAFDKKFQNYKPEFVKENKDQNDSGLTKPPSYYGPTTTHKAAGVEKLVKNKK